jgi:hypothetical protein
MRLLLLAEEEAIARSGKCGSKQEARPADVCVPAREALGELQQQQQQQQQQCWHTAISTSLCTCAADDCSIV